MVSSLHLVLCYDWWPTYVFHGSVCFVKILRQEPQTLFYPPLWGFKSFKGATNGLEYKNRAGNGNR